MCSAPGLCLCPPRVVCCDIPAPPVPPPCCHPQPPTILTALLLRHPDLPYLSPGFWGTLPASPPGHCSLASPQTSRLNLTSYTTAAFFLPPGALATGMIGFAGCSAPQEAQSDGTITASAAGMLLALACAPGELGIAWPLAKVPDLNPCGLPLPS